MLVVRWRKNSVRWRQKQKWREFHLYSRLFIVLLEDLLRSKTCICDDNKIEWNSFVPYTTHTTQPLSVAARNDMEIARMFISSCTVTDSVGGECKMCILPLDSADYIWVRFVSIGKLQTGHSIPFGRHTFLAGKKIEHVVARKSISSGWLTTPSHCECLNCSRSPEPSE